MNKRQAKKAYKKKYGHNPPKTEVQYNHKEWGRIAAKAAEGIAEGIKRIVPAITEMVSAAMAAAKEAIENIKTMPEEDFNRLLENSDLDEGTKALARQIRRNGQYELHTGNNAAERTAERTGGERASTERRPPDN